MKLFINSILEHLSYIIIHKINNFAVALLQQFFKLNPFRFNDVASSIITIN